MQEGNLLFYGDNLDILRGRDQNGRPYIDDECVDLVYLDPPFNSNQDYNVLFADKHGSRSAAQIKAFEDTWHWDQAAEAAWQDVVERADKIADAMRAFRTFLGENDMMAYLAMMAPRLIELHRVLKATGSIYLHCDPAASHYLKMLMDAIFTPQMFRNEIIWRRTGSHNSARRYGPIHDVILFYSKTDTYFFKRVFRPYLKGHVESYFKAVDEHGRRYWTNALTGAGTRNGESGESWHGYNPTDRGRHWAVPGKIVQELGIDASLTVQDRLTALDAAKFVLHPPKDSNAMPTYRQFLDSSPGMLLQDIWAYHPHTRGVLWGTDEGIDEDVRWLTAQGDEERLGYPTQKPEALLERIINASSKEGDLVLDPFCGCGTTVAAAERLKRKWIGIDVTHLAIALMKHRLHDSFGDKVEYDVIGEPADLDGAANLAREDPYQFQWWALGLLRAQPIAQKKGADRGIDGRLYFHDEGPGGKTKQAIFSVKAGKVQVSHVRDLVGVLDREKAEMGVFISLEEPTREMKTEAVTAGFYRSPVSDDKAPRLQLLTIEEILGGKRIDFPGLHGNITFKQAPAAKGKTAADHGDLFTGTSKVKAKGKRARPRGGAR